jgi:hypothetical protein
MLQYMFFDVALHIFAMCSILYFNVTFEVFCTLLGQGRGEGTGSVAEQGQGRGGEQRRGGHNSIPLYLIRFCGGRASLRRGAASGRSTRVERPGARMPALLSLRTILTQLA